MIKRQNVTPIKSTNVKLLVNFFLTAGNLNNRFFFKGHSDYIEGPKATDVSDSRCTCQERLRFHYITRSLVVVRLHFDRRQGQKNAPSLPLLLQVHDNKNVTSANGDYVLFLVAFLGRVFVCFRSTHSKKYVFTSGRLTVISTSSNTETGSAAKE